MELTTHKINLECEIHEICTENNEAVIQVYHNYKKLFNCWARNTIYPRTPHASSSYKRPKKFKKGHAYKHVPVDKLYQITSQQRNIGIILESKELAAQLIKTENNLFLSHGHLAARSDFRSKEQQEATFNYLNVAPQWQSFNGGNWLRIENRCYYYTNKYNRNVEVYTGTHGILCFNDVNGNPKELFLDAENKKCPVSKIFYKIIIDRHIDSGVAFIGVNNPYASAQDIVRDYNYGKDVSDLLDFKLWDRTNIRAGFCYAVEVSELVKRIPELPKTLRVKNLLVSF